MKTKKRWVFRLSGVLAVVAVLGAIVVAITRQSTQLVKLDSGQTVELLAVMPPGQTYSVERPWHRWGRRFLPQKLQGWIPPMTLSLPLPPSNSDELSVVLMWRDSSKPVGWPDAIRGVIAEAEDGFLYPLSTSHSTPPTMSGSKKPLFTQVQLESFPRRQSRFRLHFIRGMGVSVGSIMVPNPLPRTFGQWEPDPMPIRRTNGPVVLTLESLSAVEGPLGYDDPVAKWNRTTLASRWANIGPVVHEMEDITGNKNQTRGWHPGLRLSPAESAWKVTARVTRDHWEDFAQDERIVLTNVSIPGPDSFLGIESPAATNGHDRIVGFVGGPGRIKLEDVLKQIPDLNPAANGEFIEPFPFFRKQAVWTGLSPFVRLDLQNVSLREKVWVRAIDTEGRSQLVQNVRPIATGNAPACLVFEGPIKLEKGAQLQALEIIVSRPLEFEFFVDPKEVLQNTATDP